MSWIVKLLLSKKELALQALVCSRLTVHLNTVPPTLLDDDFRNILPSHPSVLHGIVVARRPCILSHWYTSSSDSIIKEQKFQGLLKSRVVISSKFCLFLSLKFPPLFLETSIVWNGEVPVFFRKLNHVLNTTYLSRDFKLVKMT